MSKVNTLFSYFQKTPAREKSSAGESCKVDDNANIQSSSSSDVNRAVTSKKSSKRQRSPIKLFSAQSKKPTGGRDQPANIGKLAKKNGDSSFG